MMKYSRRQSGKGASENGGPPQDWEWEGALLPTVAPGLTGPGYGRGSLPALPSQTQADFLPTSTIRRQLLQGN